MAPTGSGKTLAAFLWSIDQLWAHPRAADQPRCRVIYVSPLKALAVDVERNLASPLVGIQHAARRHGKQLPEISVAMRSGDTPAAERRAFAKNGADVLITTPESLFLLLTSAAREALAGVQTVIVDEIHAVAGTKRGAHLGVTLDRLDALLERPAQRIGLSATVAPVEEVARYLTGSAPATIIAPPAAKSWDLQVRVPVPDMTDPGSMPTRDTQVQAQVVAPAGAPAPSKSTAPSEAIAQSPGPVLPDLPGLPSMHDWAPSTDPTERASIWPHVERQIVDLVTDASSTLVFANSRRLAERVTNHLNEIWDDSHQPNEDATPSPEAPAEVMGASGIASAAPAVLARAHHGSVSKEHRADIENALKTGSLPAVVATSSLELGIDMGAVDLVVQIESPPSVASGLQRVGRAGHQVGATSRGVFFPKHRGDLVQTAVVVDRMRAGGIESLRVPSNPLDVLAQQMVAMVALDEWPLEDMFNLIRRSAAFATLPRSIFEATLDMLSGRYPSEDFADLKPRITWDRLTDTLSARRGAQLLAVTSGGTIPDRGLYAVMLATGAGPGRRVGELDEEMVYESRVGDVFTLGTTSWRIEDITHDQVLVTPAPGQIGRLPFWKGDTLGRPAELGQAVGAFIRQASSAPRHDSEQRLAASGLDEWAVANVLDYLAEQKEATTSLPDDHTVVIERFRDEIGDWRVVIHSPFGTPVHAPWALCLSARLRERFGTDVQAMAADDGIVLRLPDLSDDGDSMKSFDAELAQAITLDPDEVHGLVTEQVGGSALFAARFRECAARALLLPRRKPGRRQPLWQQRQRSAQLLEVASQYPSFPIVLEAVRECLQDVYDVDALRDLMKSINNRSIRVVTVATTTPSPMARSLLMGYLGQFLYEGDSPIAERRAAALSLDPALLAELLGRGDGAALRDLLDPQVVEQTHVELQRLTSERACRDANDIVDMLRTLGPLDTGEIHERTQQQAQDQVTSWLALLQEQRRVIEVRIAGVSRWADAQDAARLRDALGVPLSPGLANAFTESVPDPLGDLMIRYARTHTPFTVAQVATRYGLGSAVVDDVASRLVSDKRLTQGALRPLEVGESDAGARDLCDPDVLRRLRRRSLAALRQEVEPVDQATYARFLPQWQSVAGMRGVDGTLRAVEQLAGTRLPASALESLILPARVKNYAAAMLDELMSSGEVLWQGHGSLPGDDGWISLHLGDTAHLTLAAPQLPDDDLASRVLPHLGAGGAYFFRNLSDAVGRDGGIVDDSALHQALWELVWAGQATGDTLAPIRALLSGGHTSHKTRRSAPRTHRYSRPSIGLAGRPTRPSAPLRAGPPTAVGRWSLLPPIETDETVRALAGAEQLLDRYGVLTRGSVAAEGIAGGYAGVYRILAAAEEAGKVRRGYFVENLGAAQFGSSGAVDRLRASGSPERAETQPAILLAATDPANPFGASIPWPELTNLEVTHRPGRKAGAMVVLWRGELVAYLERGGKTVLTWTEQDEVLGTAATSIAAAIAAGSLAGLTIQKINGESALQAGPFSAALQSAGFHTAPQGLRLRR